MSTTNVQVSDISLQPELTATKAQVTDLSLQTELTATNVQVSDISLQVEIIPTIPMYQDHTAKIELLIATSSSEIAEAGTDADTIVITGHGLSANDFIVNTTRRSPDMNGVERGSRRVLSVTDNTLTVDSISGQTSGDSINLFHFTDVSSYVALRSIRLGLNSANEDTLSFTINSPADDTGVTLLPLHGQMVRVTIDDDVWFTGIVTQTRRKKTSVIGVDTSTHCSIQVTCVPLKVRCNNRTVIVDYAKGTLATTIITNTLIFLLSEGIKEGTVSTSYALDETWKSDCVSITEIFDELAEKSGCIWYIDKDFKFHFHADVSLELTPVRTIEYDGAFTDYRNVEVSSNCADYANKLFVIGGNDSYGNSIIASRGDMISQNAMQNNVAGSGVFGQVIRNGSLQSYTEYLAEAGTTTTNLTITGAGNYFLVGDAIKNHTRDAYMYVVSFSDINNVTVTEVPGQTSGDLILVTTEGTTIAKRELNRKYNDPISLTFNSFDMTFLPRQKLYINLPMIGVDNSYWNIESVQISDVGGGLFMQDVTCVLADESNFITWRRENKIYDFFRNY